MLLMNNQDLWSWQHYHDPQQLSYEDQKQLNTCIAKLLTSAPLVSYDQIQSLLGLLAKAHLGKLFVIQGGECGETFKDAKRNAPGTIKLLHALANILEHGLSMPIVCIGRIAGQFAKPRSNLTEADKQILTYRGDLINSLQPGINARKPDPMRLLQGYNLSSDIQQYIDTLVAVDSKTPSIFTSHEALNLFYESALTREIDGNLYNGATHMPWLGVRTNSYQQAHAHYVSAIANPIGIKIGPNSDLTDITKLIQKINPHNILGKIVIITRMGHANADKLNTLVAHIQAHDLSVVWFCDPMHGNTSIKHQVKLRFIDDMIKEISYTVDTLKTHHTRLSGIHLELTNEPITECKDNQHTKISSSLVDPRLNAKQSMKIIHKLQSMLN